MHIDGTDVNCDNLHMYLILISYVYGKKQTLRT